MGQIGVFLRAAATADNIRKKEELRLSWYSNNATQAGLHKVLATMGKSTEPSQKKHEKDMDNWNEMASFFGGLN